MADVTITVRGPGGVISQEMIIIRRALEAAGIKVEVVDSHPCEPEQEDAVLAHRAELRNPESETRKRIDSGKYTYTDRGVKLVADHLPWGG